jgi:hypothetical protein
VHWAWGGVAGVAVLLAVLWNSGALLGLGGAPDADPADRPPVLRPPLAPAGSPVTWLGDWVRTDGRWIYYRYEVWLPGACEHPTYAVGNWGKEGKIVESPVHCIDQAWLAVDVERLGQGFAIQPSTTYCIGFMYVANSMIHWGRHGSADAPGLNSIRVIAPNGAYNIGFAVVRDGSDRQRVYLTNEYDGPLC